MGYFDHNATTLLHPIARDAWLRASDEHWHNPSSPYRPAARARLMLNQCRSDLAEMIGVDARQIVFTAGATEAANTILSWFSRTYSEETIAVTATEHPCLLESARTLFGDRMKTLPVLSTGIINLNHLHSLLHTPPVPGMLVLMMANNETGVIQPYAEVLNLVKGSGKPMLTVCDAVQWAGKMPLSDLAEADFIFASGHKFGAPKGVGFMVLREAATEFAGLLGGSQEGGHRAGTENVPSIYAMVELLKHLNEVSFPDTQNRDAFLANLQASLAVAVNGHDAPRLWNTLSLVMPAFSASRWIARLDKHGFQVSSGSACATAKQGPSHVLAAMGLSTDAAQRTIRISAGRDTTSEDWEAMAAAIRQVYRELNDEGGHAVSVIKID